MRRAGGAGVGVGQEQQAVGNALADDLLERLRLVGPVGELGVGVADGQQVVRPEALGVGVGEVERLAVADLDEGRGVVHHRGPAARAGGEVVGEAERVPDLVRRELPDAGQDHRRRLGRRVEPRQVLRPRPGPRGAGPSGRLAGQ